MFSQHRFVIRRYSRSAAALGMAAALAFLLIGSRASAADEIVAFRLASWKAAHFDAAQQGEAFAATLQKLGCETKTTDHAGRVDVQYRCPRWLSLKADSHDAAHKWERWLKSHGFETKHEH